MNSRLKDSMSNNLFKCILMLKDLEECQNFFDDLCTIAEIKSMAQRLEVAKMLKEGKTYIEVSEILGASTATISRVNRALNYGSNGYNTVLNRLLNKE